MINQDLADIFRKMAVYHEMLQDQNFFFRSRALKKAADIVESFPFDLGSPEWANVERLKKLDGIGEKIAWYIVEYAKNGELSEYIQMKKDSPVKLEELLRIQGIGPQKIMKLYRELKVTDIDSLKQAAETNQIAELEGFGEKSQTNILESIQFAIQNKDRVLISVAEETAESLLNYMKQDKNLIKIEVAGSYRRKKETIGDIDILVVSKNPSETMNHFVNYPNSDKVLGHGDTKSSIWLKNKIQADMRIVPEGSFGSALQYFTGSKEHNVKLRNIAISQKYKLSEYGLFKRVRGNEKQNDKSDKPVIPAKAGIQNENKPPYWILDSIGDPERSEIDSHIRGNDNESRSDNEGEKVEGASEEGIYTRLGLQFIPPELRENEGEIELARKKSLPNLISISDIVGDLHTHTTHSDGVNTIEEMADKAKSLGYKYIGISDHFGKLKIANAIDETQFDKYLADIRSAKLRVKGIKIYAGAEVEIGKNGELEFDPNKLKQLDYVIASVHFSTKMTKDEMTERLLKALDDPFITILAHPTGRILNQRPGFEFDYKLVFEKAKEKNVALEINAHPSRLDLNDVLVKLAISHGCKIAISTDAHSAVELDNMRFGVNIARRGWVERKDLFYYRSTTSM